jgi:hypothetical protein
MEEKRKSTRFKINQLIAYLPNREEYLYAEGIDLSRGGVRCSSAQGVDTMTNVFLMVKVPAPEGERLVRCEGYVSHSRMEAGKCIFGVRISEVYADDKPFFEAYLDSLESSAEPNSTSPPAALPE